MTNLIKTKAVAQRPWIGSYFGISEQDQVPTPNTGTVELELHILKKDLTTQIISLKTLNDGTGNDKEVCSLSKIARNDSEAIASVLYKKYLTPNGEMSSERTCYPTMRTSSGTWVEIEINH